MVYMYFRKQHLNLIHMCILDMYDVLECKRVKCQSVTSRKKRKTRMNLMNGIKKRSENVRVIIRAFILQNGHDALEAHSGVNVFGRQ